MLGTEIAAPAAEHAVHTTVDQRRATGRLVDELSDPQAPFAHHGVPLGGSGHSYATVTPRRGSWADLSVHERPEIVRADVLTVGTNHGPHPATASYAWLVLPATTAEATAARARRPGLSVVNTSDEQAVRCDRTGASLSIRHEGAGIAFVRTATRP